MFWNQCDFVSFSRMHYNSWVCLFVHHVDMARHRGLADVRTVVNGIP